MQIKQRGRNVQLLRAEYQPAKKRSIQKSIGTFDASDCLVITEVPESILEALDDAERKELEAWFEKRACQRKALQPYLSPALFQVLKNAAIATEIAANVAVDIEIEENDLRQLVGAWQKLTKVMRSKKLQTHLISLPQSVNDPEKVERVIVRYIKIHRDVEEEEKSKLAKELIAELEQTSRS